MSERLTIADLHLGHRKAPLFRNFANLEEHDEHVVDSWNSVVGAKDIVYVLGDVAINRSQVQQVGRLKGRKKLIGGNHDPFQTDLYREYFEGVYGCLEFQDAILTHIPIHPDYIERWRGNVHGHLHDKVVTHKVGTGWMRSIFFDAGGGRRRRSWPSPVTEDLPNPRYRCVSCEQVAFKPISLEEIIQQFPEAEKKK